MKRESGTGLSNDATVGVFPMLDQLSQKKLKMSMLSSVTNSVMLVKESHFLNRLTSIVLEFLLSVQKGQFVSKVVRPHTSLFFLW